MKAEEIIQSGKLEAYVLGLTTEAENKEIENVLDSSKELRDELYDLQRNLESYLVRFAQKPPEALRKRIMEQLKFRTIDKVLEPAWYKKPWAIAASWAFLIGSLIGNVYFMNKWQSSEKQLSDLRTKNTELAENSEVLKAKYSETDDVLAKYNFNKIALKATEAGQPETAVVYYQKDIQKVYLSQLNVPEPAAGKQYQLWAIVDGKPVDAGLVEGNMAGKFLKNTLGATAFAVSIEAAGGSTTAEGPKGKIVLMGAV